MIRNLNLCFYHDGNLPAIVGLSSPNLARKNLSGVTRKCSRAWIGVAWPTTPPWNRFCLSRLASLLTGSNSLQEVYLSSKENILLTPGHFQLCHTWQFSRSLWPHSGEPRRFLVCDCRGFHYEHKTSNQTALDINGINLWLIWTCSDRIDCRQSILNAIMGI